MLGDSLEPLADVGHSLSEAAIKHERERHDEGGELCNVSQSKSVTNQVTFALEVSVEYLDLILNSLDCVIVLSEVKSHAEGVVGDLASVRPVACCCD